MIALLTAGLVLLACVTALNLVLNLAIIRKLRILGPAGHDADTGAALPDLGSRIGRFQVTTTAGEIVSDATFARGRHQIIVLSPSCAPCRDLASRLTDDPTIVADNALILVTGEADLARPMAAELAALRRTAYDEGDVVAEALSVTGFPAVLSIADGTVVEAEHRLVRRQPVVVTGR